MFCARMGYLTRGGRETEGLRLVVWIVLTGCVVDEKDLQETADGSYANALALNRWCPSPRCTEQPDGSCT